MVAKFIIYELIFDVMVFTSSSSSCHAASTDLPDPLSPPVSVVHCAREIFKTTSCIGTELLYIGSSCLCSSMWWGPQEYVAYEFVLTSPAVFCMSEVMMSWYLDMYTSSKWVRRSWKAKLVRKTFGKTQDCVSAAPYILTRTLALWRVPVA